MKGPLIETFVCCVSVSHKSVKIVFACFAGVIFRVFIMWRWYGLGVVRVHICVPVEDKKLLVEVCRKRGEDISSFVRRAIRKELAALSFYPEDVKKALGLTKREEGDY